MSDFRKSEPGLVLEQVFVRPYDDSTRAAWIYFGTFVIFMALALIIGQRNDSALRHECIETLNGTVVEDHTTPRGWICTRIVPEPEAVAGR